MRNRPDYMPPIHFGEGRRPESPRGVYWTLLSEVPSVAAAVILLFIFHAPMWIRILGIIVLVVICVEAVVYIPRARRAMAEERAASGSGPLSRHTRRF
jgi:hypothetical protein